VLSIDVSTGQSKGGVELPFAPTTGLVRDGHLFLAGNGVGCIDSQGQLLWAASQPATSELWSFDFSLHARDADGRELWRVDSGSAANPPGLCFGELVAQPDLRG
jgi:hypothetical protein